MFAGAAIAAAFTSANAADLPPVMQARPIAPVQVEEMTGGWYLRGDIGVGRQQFKSFDFTQTNNAFVWPASWRKLERERAWQATRQDVHAAQARARLWKARTRACRAQEGDALRGKR